jgi:hypothetical protein
MPSCIADQAHHREVGASYRLLTTGRPPPRQRRLARWPGLLPRRQQITVVKIPQKAATMPDRGLPQLGCLALMTRRKKIGATPYSVVEDTVCKKQEIEMNWILLAPGNWAEPPGFDLTSRRGQIHFDKIKNTRAIFVATAALSLISCCAYGQTTPTSSSATSTTKTIPSSSSTSANSPCASSNPTSPCYSANAPRAPCYNAAAPNQPCSTTTAPYAQTSAPPTPSAVIPITKSPGRAFTEDQAKSQIEAKGYSSVGRLQKDDKGTWRGKAEKEGLPANVTLDVKGNVDAY